MRVLSSECFQQVLALEQSISEPEPTDLAIDDREPSSKSLAEFFRYTFVAVKKDFAECTFGYSSPLT